jgi:hypothetical protein
MPRRAALQSALRLILAWLFLNLVFNTDYPEALPTLLDALRPSLEVWGLLLALSSRAALSPGPSTAFRISLIVLFVFVRLFRIGDVLMPLYFSRPFNLYFDSGYVPDLIHLLSRSFASQNLLLVGGAVVALVILLPLGIHKAFQVALEAFSFPRLRRIFWGLTAALAVWVVFFPQSMNPYHAGVHPTTCTPRLLEEAEFMTRIGDLRREWDSAVRTAAVRIPPSPVSLARLEKTDVYLFIIESYGETLFDETRHAGEFLPLVRNFEAGLNRAGFAVCSHYLESPTSGGSSWLAFGTLESGIRIPDQLRYELLLNSRVQPLAGYFNDTGYRTVSVMPGTTMEWPEGRYFQYHQTYYCKDLDYRGPPFNWSPMPDQYVIKAVHQREIVQRSQPLFIRYMLTSTHAPFNLQPPFFPNWTDIGNGEIYHHRQPVVFSVNWPDMSEAGKAYLSSVRYDFTVLEDYLCRFVEDGALIIILGDHQPIAPVTGPNASACVPVHVISRNRALLEPFARLGYKPGMVPRPDPRNAKAMQDFLADFLEAFGTHRPGELR